MSPSLLDARLSFIRGTVRFLEETDRAAVLLQTANQLETGSLIDIPTRLVELGIDSWTMSLPERRAVLGVNPPHVYRPGPKERRLHQWLTSLQESARRSMWCYRVGDAMVRLRDWYPFFVTLTVDPKVADARKIISEGVEWRRYRQRVAECVRKRLGLPQQSKGGPPTSEYFQYVAVVEHGKSREHHHIHALLWLKEIPDYWKRDPNIGRRVPNATDCIPMKSFWPWGSVTKASPFRHVGDIWSRMGWQVPIKDGKPMTLLPPLAAGNYLMKYLGKEHKEWRHRVKATRRLGMQRLDEALAKLPTKMLYVLSVRPWSPMARARKMRSDVPGSVMRLAAKHELLSRLWRTRSGRRQLTKWMTSARLDAYSTMRRSVMDGARPFAMDSVQLSTWLTECAYHPEASVSSELEERAWNMVEALFPRAEPLLLTALAGMRRK